MNNHHTTDETDGQVLKPTLGEEITELYSRVAKLNDIASALLAPAWGSEVGIIPTDHPLYVGEADVAPRVVPSPPPVDRAARSDVGTEFVQQTDQPDPGLPAFVADLAADQAANEFTPVLFTYTDSSGDRLTAELATGVDGLPVAALIAEQNRDVACVHLPLDQVESLIAAVGAVLPSADRAALRDRIAAALYERERPPRDPHWPEAFAADREVFEAMADAVLAVLPSSPTRADTLREASDAGDDEGDELTCVDMCGSCDACGMEPFGTPAEGWREAARFLRRTARDSGDRVGALRGARLIEAELRRLAEEECDERQAQANLGHLADELAAALASCPGRELSPNPCRCPCYGCKHHCAAHDPSRVADEAQPDTETQPPHPPGRQWQVETRRDADSRWMRNGPAWDDPVEGRESYDFAVQETAERTTAHTREYRLVRATTTYAVEASYTPAKEA